MTTPAPVWNDFVVWCPDCGGTHARFRTWLRRLLHRYGVYP